MKSRYLLWALRAHRHVTPDAYAYANSKYIGAQTHGKQGMSALREVLMTHDVSETVRTYLNARGIVHTKRTCKTAAANVSEAEIIASLIYDKDWGFKWLLRHATKNNNTQILQFLYTNMQRTAQRRTPQSTES